MFKLLGWIMLLGAAFGAGYYVGQHPIDELKKTVADLTRTVKDTTLGFERSVRLRQGLMDAKSDVIQAKSELLDKNFGNALASLVKAVEHLEKASEAERDAGKTQRVKPLLAKVQDAKRELSAGKSLSRTTLDEMQKELDMLLQ